MAVGLWVAACGGPPADPEVLARVGDVEIRLADVRAFEGRLVTRKTPQKGDEAAHRQSLQTLVDREVLLLEARAQNLHEDPEVQQKLADHERRRLADEMMERNVLKRAEIDAAEIRQAYEDGWNERAIGLEIFVGSRAKAAEVLELVAAGVDFAEIGRQHSTDFFFDFPTGAARRFDYFPFEGPAEIVQAVFALPTGGVSEPLPFMRGFVIDKLEARRPVPFEEIEEGIRDALYKKRRRLLRGVYLQQLNKELDLQFHDEGLARAVALLKGAEGDDGTPALSYGEVTVDAGQVAEWVAPAIKRGQTVDAERVVAVLKNDHLPERLMALDAIRQGVDASPPHQKWRQRHLEDLMLGRLQQHFVEKIVTVTEDEIQAYYRDNKRRYRIPGRARLKDLLVEEEDLAEELARQLASGADLDALIKEHSIRRNAVDGVIRVFPIQATIYGQEWMDAVMAAPLNTVQGPIPTKGGYSIFAVIERQPESHYTLEQKRVRRSAEQAVREKKEMRQFNSYLKKLHQKYSDRVEVFEERLEGLHQPSSPAEAP